MGLNLDIALNPRIDNLDPNAADRAVLAKYGNDVNRITLSAGVATHSSFYSYDLETAAELLDDAALEELQRKGTQLAWFDPGLGLITVRAIREPLRDPAYRASFNSEQAVQGLDNLEKIPLEAAAKGSMFRLYSAF